MGQGLFTKVAQVVAHELGVPLAAVRVSASDTSKVPNASPTAASSGSDLNGMAARDAARALKARLAEFAAAKLGGAPADVVFAGGEVRAGDADAALRRTRAPRVFRAGAAVGDGLLRDPEDPLRPQDADRSPVLLLRLGRRGVRGRRRHADRRVPAAGGRHPARRRVVAESRDRPRPDRGRLPAGLGLADDGSAVVERRRRAEDAFAVDVQDPDRARVARALRHRLPRPAQRRGHDPSQQGRRRAAVHAGAVGVPRDPRRDRQRRRRPRRGARRAGDRGGDRRRDRGSGHGGARRRQTRTPAPR